MQVGLSYKALAWAGAIKSLDVSILSMFYGLIFFIMEGIFVMRLNVALVCLFFCTPALFAQDDQQGDLLSLVQDRSFAFFDLGLSHDQINLLKNLSIVISTKSAMNNYGDLETLELQICDYLKNLGNCDVDAQAASHIIYSIVSRDVAACGMETGWVTLRAFNPNNLYDLPRWHTDGSIYDGPNHRCYKLVYVFQGAPTLLLEVPEDVRAEMLSVQSKSGVTSAQIKNLSRKELDDVMYSSRLKLAALLAQYTPSQVPAASGIIFITGDANRKTAAIHSEPPMHENRLFMSIVPGSREQIEQWRARSQK